MVRGPDYSDDEWVVLLYYFRNRPEPEHTDSHPALQRFAASIGRRPSSVDSSLRNIKSYVANAGLSHGAARMRAVVDRYRQQSATLTADAQVALSRINMGATLP